MYNESAVGTALGFRKGFILPTIYLGFFLFQGVGCLTNAGIFSSSCNHVAELYMFPWGLLFQDVPLGDFGLVLLFLTPLVNGYILYIIGLRIENSSERRGPEREG
jgi:hypothetical protein